MSHRRVLLIALIAALFGAGAGFLVNGPGPLWRSELGQRVLQQAAGAAAAPPPPGVSVAEVGDPMPALRLRHLDGRTTILPADIAPRRPLLINVWASWCGPCIEEMPELQRYSEAQGAGGVQVIGLALDDAASVRAFLKRVPVRYPIVLDTPGPADASVRLGNVRGVLPYSVLIGADGRLLRQRLGPFAPGELDGFDDVLGAADRR
jgi:thiol-disulfide isomerase/thioredoxin